MAIDRTREELLDRLVAPLQELGLDLEAVDLTPAGRRRVLRVAVDKDGGVTLDDVAEATKAVSALLDGSDVMGEQPYLLEVTSPGIDRPLTLPRHWRRNVGRLVKVTTQERSTFTGRVVASDEDHAQVLVEEGPEASDEPRSVAFADVASARVQVEFNRKDD